MRVLTHLCAAASVAACLAQPAGHAASYPDKPVTVLVPFVPGGSSDITAKVFEDAGSLSDANLVRVQVAHLTFGVPQVYVHVTTPDADLSENTVLGTVAFDDDAPLGPVEIDAGDYQIRVTTDAAGTSVAFNSGTVTLAAGSDLLVGAIPNTSGLTDSPVALAVLNGTEASVIYDADDGAQVRPVHLVSDVDEVNIGAAANTTPGDDVTDFSLYTNVDFTQVGAYTSGLASGSYDFAVDATADDQGDITLDGANLTAGVSVTAFAMGTLGVEMGDDIPLTIETYVDDHRGLATSAKVRIIHGSAGTGLVDLYATASDDISSATPAFEDVPFKASTGYFEVDPGTYHFTATLADTQTIGLASGAVTLEAGDIITIIARDLDSDDSEEGAPLLQALVISD